MLMSKGGLGRGLSSLIPNKSFGFEKQEALSVNDFQNGSALKVKQVNPDNIIANPYQPRTVFEEAKLKELADSIREHGILNPLVAIERADGRCELIAGERRLRAARDIGLRTVPVIVRVADNKKQLELSLIENIQREDLNPMERAVAYDRLMREFSLTQEKIAERIGKPRSGIANTVRLLQLPEAIQESLRRGEISEGHAKIILSVNGGEAQVQLWQKIKDGSLPVRAAEGEARSVQVKRHTRRATSALDPNLKHIQEELEARLGTKIVIKGTLERGTVIIEYFSREELDRMSKQWLGNELLL